MVRCDQNGTVRHRSAAAFDAVENADGSAGQSGDDPVESGFPGHLYLAWMVLG
jgi:hypothetical protein